jgi:phenylpropionate dioxygenase-like ring-hydroxylating dioxygenase large terminal subunit
MSPMDDAPLGAPVIEAAPASLLNGEETPLRKRRRELARAAVEHARNGTTAEASYVRHEDISFFTDPELFAREHQRFFRETPLVACVSSELEAGSYRLFEDTGVPILITRGKDGKVRAFLNVCPHRGAKVVREDCGKASRFTCRFHGWTFDATGKAIGIPEEQQFCGEVHTDLTPCPAEERHGLVFVQPTPNGVMDLDGFLGAFGAEIEVLELGSAVRVHGVDLPVTGNWKYGLDTFFETYHLTSLHKETFRGLFSPVCVFERFGPHHRYTFAPLAVHEWVDQPESEWNLDLLPLQYFLFPNTILSAGSTSRTGFTVNIHRIFPQAVGHFVSKMSYCAIHGIKSPEHQAEIDASYKVAMRALTEEDYSVTGESFRGLTELPPGTTLPVGRREIGVENFHRNVAEAMGL